MTDRKAYPGSAETVTSATLLTAAAEDLEGTVLEHKYRLERFVGAGGMGQVYRAEHLTLGVPIAVKVMHAGVAHSRENAIRFRREAHAASLLQHRNVVRVLDFGESMGRLFIVMEFLTGEPLSQYLGRLEAPPPLSEVVDLLEQVLDALGAAHEAGIVHRDLKPDNVFLMHEPGGARVVKVVDFGLAHVDDVAMPETLTQKDMVAGTPQYMSPEQCRSLAVGPSTDLYAFGCILTEMLQLAPPFGGAAAMDIIAKQMFWPVEPLRRPAGAEAVPELLERLRRALLEKAPERRPRSASETRQRLHEAIDGETERARFPSRSAQVAFRDRDERAPDWPVVDATERIPSARANELTRVTEVRLVELGEALDDEAILALRTQAIAITRDPGDAARAIYLHAPGRAQEAEAWLRKNTSADPVVVGTTVDASDTVARLVSAGASDVVTAPIRAAVVAKKLARVLRRGR